MAFREGAYALKRGRDDAADCRDMKHGRSEYPRSECPVRATLPFAPEAAEDPAANGPASGRSRPRQSVKYAGTGGRSMSTVPSWQISLTTCTNLPPRFHIFMFALATVVRPIIATIHLCHML